MKKNFMNKMSFLLVLMMVAAFIAGCGQKTENTAETAAQNDTKAVETVTDTEAVTATEVITDTESTEMVMGTETDAEYEKVGKGDTTFFFISIDADKKAQYFEVSTDEKTVGAALLALDMIAGEDSEYGLYVKSVNGVTADYDKDGTYWAFYIDGEYASTGVDATDITEGATYTFAVEK